jgi:hypothetical protein
MKSRFDEKALHRDPQAFEITSFHTAKWALKRRPSGFEAML